MRVSNLSTWVGAGQGGKGQVHWGSCKFRLWYVKFQMPREHPCRVIQQIAACMGSEVRRGIQARDT